MDRNGLRDDEWERIKDFLLGRVGHTGGTASDNRLFVDAIPPGARGTARLVSATI
jgi:hypothetical protein